MTLQRTIALKFYLSKRIRFLLCNKFARTYLQTDISFVLRYTKQVMEIVVLGQITFWEEEMSSQFIEQSQLLSLKMFH